MQMSTFKIITALDVKFDMSDIIQIIDHYINTKCSGYPFRFVKEFEPAFNDLLLELDVAGDDWIRIQIVKPGDDEK